MIHASYAGLGVEGGLLEEAHGLFAAAVVSETMYLRPARSWLHRANRAAFWSLENLYSDEQCYELFRFRRADLPKLLQELQLPVRARDGRVVVRGRCVFDPMELLCTFLGRMAYPCTWERHCMLMHGSSPTRCREGFYFVLKHVYSTFRRCISAIDMWVGNCQVWADAIHAAGGPAPRCIGFLDGTFRPCARPSMNQELLYSGYDKLHGIKFQAVVAPNGLIVDLYGCFLGRRSDSYMLAKSGFLSRMENLCASEGSLFYVYGDPAYALSLYILRGFKGAMSPMQKWFSREMSRVRESVEWGFGAVIQDWAFVDFKKNMKLYKQPVGQLYYVAALLTNMKICLTAEHNFDGYGSKIAEKFGRCSPPTLRAYLHD